MSVEAEDKELVDLVFNKVQEARFLRKYKIYVGPEMYERIRNEFYLQKRFDTPTPIFNYSIDSVEIVVVYPNDIKL